MENRTYVNINGINVDVEKADRLVQKLIATENKFIKTKTKESDDSKMFDIIKKMIEEEVECY